MSRHLSHGPAALRTRREGALKRAMGRIDRLSKGDPKDPKLLAAQSERDHLHQKLSGTGK